jgi:transcriptional antiterminator RfaH
MDLWNQTNWHAVQTKPSRENFAAANIGALGVEFLLPKAIKERWVRGNLQTIVTPLFSGYLFARFCPACSLDAVRCARGVSRVLCSGRYPVPVEEDVIGQIQMRAEANGCIRVSPKLLLQPGSRVTIKNGPFQEFIGRVEREWDDGKRVMLLLEAMQHARVLVHRSCLSAAPTVN